MTAFFLICSDGEVMSFDSAASLTAYTESPDVESGEYLGAFDSVGTPLRLTLARPTERSTFLGLTTLQLTPVSLEPGAVSDGSREELRQHLVHALGVSDESVPLEDLVQDAAKRLKTET